MDKPKHQIPVLHDDIASLIQRLLEAGYAIYVEATGHEFSEIRRASSPEDETTYAKPDIRGMQHAYAQLECTSDGFQLITEGEKMSKLLQEQIEIVQNS